MSTTIKLGEVAEIQSGYSFRGAVKDEGAGVAVIQARDIDGLSIASGHLPRVKQDFPPSRYLSHGDVLLTSRGTFRAGAVDFSDKAVASSSLFVLHTKATAYMPEFIALYLNSAYAQNYLKQAAKGATIQSVTITDLADLTIPFVPLAQQKLLVELQQNVEAQRTLLRSKLDAVNDIYSKAINQSLKGVA